MVAMEKNKTNLNVPHLRFPEFSGEWETGKIKQVCDIATGNKNTQDKSDDGIYPFYVRSQTIERINSWSFDGEAILTAGDGVGVGKVFHYSTGKIGVHQRVYILSNFTCDSKYLFHYFSSRFYTRVKRMSAKNSVDSVRMEMIADMPIYLASKDEQRKIGYLLSLLNERIETQKKIIEKYESLIRGIVKTHYSQCESIKETRISELGKAFTTMNMSKEDLSEDGNECILYGELFTTYGCVIKDVKSKTNISTDRATKSRNNDLLFPASTTVDAMSLIAPTAIYKEGVILGGDLFGIHVNEDYNNEYLSYLINYIYKSTLARYAQGSTIIHLHYSDIKNVTLLLPSIEDQNYLAHLMRSIEAKINIEKDMLSELYRQKAYLLSNLFI